MDWRGSRSPWGEGLVTCVVVYEPDRLSRTVLDTVTLVLQEWDGVCSVRSTREPVNTTNPAGSILFYMLASFAEWERSTIRERTMSGKTKRAPAGEEPWLSPALWLYQGRGAQAAGGCPHRGGRRAAHLPRVLRRA
jgi:DNA invertase Pin-like site-specific DNA recombinase